MNKHYNSSKSKQWLPKSALILCLLLLVSVGAMAQDRTRALSILKAKKNAQKGQAATARLTKARKGITFRAGGPVRPALAQVYSADGSTWQLEEKVDLTYYLDGRVKEEVVSDATSNTPLERVTYKYNTHGEVTEELEYYWSGNAWELTFGDRTVETFENGRLTEINEQFYNSSGWETGQKFTFTYSATGVLESETSSFWNGTEMVPNFKVLYTFEAANQPPTSMLVQTWDSESWETLFRIGSITWPAGGVPITQYKDIVLGEEALPVTYTAEMGLGTAWFPVFRQKITSGANGSFVATTEEFNGFTWDPDMKTTVTYDSHGNRTLYEIAEYDETAWVIEDGEKHIFTYTGDNLTEDIVQEWDEEAGTAGAYVNDERIVYSNFQTITSSKETLARNVEVYPNPVAGKFAIKTDQAAGAHVRVTNLSGQTLLSTTLKTTAQEFDIAHLPAGTYILQIQSKAGLRTQKVVKL
ncbi:T9SS type A sorting domain-containing protein [Rufibacter sp. LB8]|uniref:T9SS type A sorting domain-containing protein n=1 Tax=Rufibacter sp. LB8 TaxID=2777781 RepID=UPI00178C57C5|nr:T9SS type A sorting domain-containing protein [Rufibacter sp. LB8]